MAVEMHKRQTYINWRECLIVIRRGNAAEILQKMYNIKDQANGHKSATNAVYSQEALDYLLREEGLS